MSLYDVEALDAEWAIWPPIRVTMAAFVGWKPPAKSSASDILGPEDLANFLSAFPGGERMKPPE